MSIDTPVRTAPVEDPVARLLVSIDQAGERAVGTLRGKQWADTGAAVASNVSDYGYVWIALAVWKARRPGPGRRRAVLALAGAGVASYGVNKMAKRLVGRSRPQGGGAAGSGRLAVRRPKSSSFPSGHTLAAFCTAMVLTEGPIETAGALGFAAVVAASRVHLEAHHASDVVGGALIGGATGLLVRHLLWRMLGAAPAPE